MHWVAGTRLLRADRHRGMGGGTQGGAEAGGLRDSGGGDRGLWIRDAGPRHRVGDQMRSGHTGTGRAEVLGIDY